jgi:hypothetical protein
MLEERKDVALMATAERTSDDLIRTSISRQFKDGDTLVQATAHRLVAAEFPLSRLLPIFHIMFSPLLGLLAPMKACHKA